jgi:hypothetical protein
MYRGPKIENHGVCGGGCALSGRPVCQDLPSAKSPIPVVIDLDLDGGIESHAWRGL